MEQNVEEQMNELGSIWVIRTRSPWSGTEKLTAEDIGKDPDEISKIIRLGRKEIAPKDVVLKLQGSAQRVRAFMENLPAQQALGIHSAWWVNDRQFIAANEGLKKILQERTEIVRKIANNMDKIKDEMVAEHPWLKNAMWPTSKQLFNRFKIEWKVYQFSGASEKSTDPEEVIALKREMNKNLEKDFNEYKEVALRAAKTDLINSIEEISNRILETGDAVTKATLNRPKKIIEKYKAVAEFFDIDSVKVKIDEVKAILNKADPKKIKNDWAISKQLGENLRKLGDDIGDLSGLSTDGRAKRRIKFDKAA